MRKAILITAHKDPAQLSRLCDALRHPDLDIYINIDLKSDIKPFEHSLPGVITFIRKRVAIRWGHISQVESTLNGLREIMGSGNEYSHVLFISGQDYPIVPMQEISRRLDADPSKEYIAWADISSGSVYDRRMRHRYRCRHYFCFDRRWARIANIPFRLLPDRKPPHTVYKGSSWWNLTAGCIRYIIDLYESDPGLIKFYRRTLCPDEMFFQSVISNSPFGKNMVNDNFRYVVFPGPKVLTAADYDGITASGKWFARKIDRQVDARIMDMLDMNIRRTMDAGRE